jgi:hypothetical protein
MNPLNRMRFRLCARLRNPGNLVVVVFFTLSGCAKTLRPVELPPDAPAVRAAAVAVEHFHAHLAKAQYADICRIINSPGYLPTDLPCAEFLAYVHDKLGSVIHAELRGHSYAGIGPDALLHIRVNYTTRFERDTAHEIFEWRIDGSDKVLTNYHIEADALSR